MYEFSYASYLLSSCRLSSISLGGSTGTDFDGADQWGSRDFPDRCTLGSSEPNVWRSSCNPRMWTGHNVYRSICPHTPCSPRWVFCLRKVHRSPEWNPKGCPVHRAPDKSVETRGRSQCSLATGLLPLPCYLTTLWLNNRYSLDSVVWEIRIRSDVLGKTRWPGKRFPVPKDFFQKCSFGKWIHACTQQPNGLWLCCFRRPRGNQSSQTKRDSNMVIGVMPEGYSVLVRKSPERRKTFNTDGELREPAERRAGPSREGHSESFTENEVSTCFLFSGWQPRILLNFELLSVLQGE